MSVTYCTYTLAGVVSVYSLHPWQELCLLPTPLTDISPLAKPLEGYFSVAKPLYDTYLLVAPWFRYVCFPHPNRMGHILRARTLLASC